jgi:hypothetical protein
MFVRVVPPGLLRVTIRVEVPPALIVEGKKILATVGGAR